MAKGRASAIVLDEAEKRELRTLTRTHGAPQSIAEGARLVLAATGGLTPNEIAAKVGVHAAAASTWRDRSAARWINDLDDEARPGAPREIGDDEIGGTIRKTQETRPKGRTHDHKRHGTTSLFAALDVTAGAIVGRCMPRPCASVFRKTLEEVECSVPAGLDVHMVMDSYGTHKSKPRRDCAAKRPRWHDHFMPASASWINQIRRVFALLAERALRGGVVRSVADREKAIHTCLTAAIAAPKAVHSTKTADDILVSIQRFSLRTVGAKV